MPRLPWWVWTSLCSVTCILVGGYWDISWHMSVGRDTFWTPAHLLIQAGGIVGGLSATYQILHATIRKRTDDTVSVWGFRGPLGAFFAAWGAATMLISAPFDNWWHNAYGLDVRILSPPHIVLTLGILGVSAGGTFQLARGLHADASRSFERLLLILGGQVLVLAMTAALEDTFRSNLHRAACYRAVGIVAPLVILTYATASRHRWAATLVAGTYTLVMALGVWLLPLIPAEPKLGPVYQPITHFIPLQFPLLILVPAIAFDLLRAPLARAPRFARALVLGPVFVALFVAAEYPFADFLMSESSRGWLFGTQYQPYFMHPEWAEPTYQFFPEDDLWRGLAMAAGYAIVTSYLGLVLGDALRRVRR